MICTVLSLLIATALSIPKTWDWRDVYAVNPVRDQGNCEASIAMVAVTIFETEYYRQTGQLPVLSVEYVLQCAEIGGCGYGYIHWRYMRRALDFLIDNGAPYQSDYPYVAGNFSTGLPVTPGICGATTVTMPNFLKYSKQHKASTGRLKYWIGKNPVACLIAANSSLRNYSGSGIVECVNNKPDDDELNHVLTAIGWDKDTNYIVQNSEGTDWGDNGYAVFKKHKECGLRRRIYRYNFGGRYGVVLVMVGLFITLVT